MPVLRLVSVPSAALLITPLPVGRCQAGRALVTPTWHTLKAASGRESPRARAATVTPGALTQPPPPTMTHHLSAKNLGLFYLMGLRFQVTPGPAVTRPGL